MIVDLDWYSVETKLSQVVITNELVERIVEKINLHENVRPVTLLSWREGKAYDPDRNRTVFMMLECDGNRCEHGKTIFWGRTKKNRPSLTGFPNLD